MWLALRYQDPQPHEVLMKNTDMVHEPFTMETTDNMREYTPTHFLGNSSKEFGTWTSVIYHFLSDAGEEEPDPSSSNFTAGTSSVSSTFTLSHVSMRPGTNAGEP